MEGARGHAHLLLSINDLAVILNSQMNYDLDVWQIINCVERFRLPNLLVDGLEFIRRVRVSEVAFWLSQGLV